MLLSLDDARQAAFWSKTGSCWDNDASGDGKSGISLDVSIARKLFVNEIGRVTIARRVKHLIFG
jgi:hypothetical protein